MDLPSEGLREPRITNSDEGDLPKFSVLGASAEATMSSYI